MGGPERFDADMPVKGVRRARVAAAVGVSALILLLGWVGPTSAQTRCAEYSAVAAADGLRILFSAPGSSPTDVDGNVPAAQAQADSLNGSVGWAGAPYSSTVSDNAGAGRQFNPAFPETNANDVPVFVVSRHPTQPEATKSSPAFTLEAKSGERESTAKAVVGGPSSEQASAGRLSTSAVASCADDTSVKAVGDNVADVLDVQSVLRIGQVRSHAEVAVDPSGQPKLNGTMAVEGATVLGQPVAITDQGVVTGSSATPLPANPLAQALGDAGISVRYIAAAKDEQQGQVLAPGLEVVVTRGFQGAGSGPMKITYLLGRAYARAARGATTAPESAAVAEVPSGPAIPGDASQPAVPADVASGLAPASPSLATGGGQSTPATTRRAGNRPTLPTASIANASSGSVYAALAVSALVFLPASFLFEKLGVKLRWR